MRALNASLIVLFATASSLVLSGCLGTNTPPAPPVAINESASGTGYVLARGVGIEDMTTTAPAGAITGGAVGTGGSASFTAYTNSGTGAYGFIANLPADATVSGTTTGPDTAVLPVGSFTAAPETVFPAGTVEASVPTYPTTSGDVSSIGVVTGGSLSDGNLLVDKFGASQSLQYSDYGIWAENGTFAGLSATAPSTVGAFAVGIPTTIMPTSGTAQYIGGAAGIATNASGGGEFAGTAVLNATFSVGGGSISGFITGPGDTNDTLADATAIPYSKAGSGGTATGTMNVISFTAPVALPQNIAGNTFTGIASAVGAGGASPANIAIDSATGTFGGQFNGGLTAAEVAGTFHLTGGANGAAVVGAFGAK